MDLIIKIWVLTLKSVKSKLNWGAALFSCSAFVGIDDIVSLSDDGSDKYVEDDFFCLFCCFGGGRGVSHGGGRSAQRELGSLWRLDSGMLFSVCHLSCCIVIPRVRGAAGMLGWWWWVPILRGLTACCTCPPPISTSLMPLRTNPHPETFKGKNGRSCFSSQTVNPVERR